MSKECKKEVLVDDYYHIDNGGIGLTVEAIALVDGKYYPMLTFDNSFYGHVANVTVIHTLSTKEHPCLLETMGNKLLEASAKLKELNKDKQ